MRLVRCLRVGRALGLGAVLTTGWACGSDSAKGTAGPGEVQDRGGDGEGGGSEVPSGMGGAGGDTEPNVVTPEPDAGVPEAPDAAAGGEQPGVMDGAAQEEPGGQWGEPLGPEVSFGGCNARMQAYRTEGNVHVELCSNINYISNPPHSGNHYPSWAAYRTYTRTIPWGFLVHSLEHGAVVITYNCPEGCAAELAQIQSFVDALPADCGGGVKRRVIVMPEPKLPVKFAASAWRHTLKADCFDPPAFQRFFTERYNKGREDSCNQGTDPTGESTGRKPLCGL